MKVDNDFLCDDDGNRYRFEDIRSYDKNIKIKPKYIILHYTAGIPIEGTIETFRTQQVSSHLVVDRDGSIIQCVPFNLRAWHAGPSQWADRTDLNSHSIGIEINNFGLVRRNAANQWERGGIILPDEDVIEATHKFLYKPFGWQIYPEAQLAAVLEILKTLIAAYDTILDIAGHDDIYNSGVEGPGGLPEPEKLDPGPAFPMDSFRFQAFDLPEGTPMKYRAARPMTMRVDPLKAAVPGGYLPNKTPVQVIARQRGWAQVDKLGPEGEVLPLQGWVPERYLKREMEAVP